MRAESAWIAGSWSWRDARLLFGGPAALYGDTTEEMRRVFFSEARRMRGRFDAATYGPEGPYLWTQMILSYRPDAAVPAELGGKLFDEAVTLDPLQRFESGWSERATAVRVMFALETPDAAHLRERVWTDGPLPFEADDEERLNAYLRRG